MLEINPFFNSVGIKSDKLLLHCIGCVVCDSPLTEIQYANLARRTASDTSICPFAVLASKNTNILWDLSTSMLSFVLSPAWTGYVIQNGISLNDNWPNLDKYWHSKQYLYSYAGRFCIQSMFPCVWLSLAITRPEWIFSPLNFIGRERSITISVYYVKPLSLTAIAQTIAIKSPFKRFAHKS